MKNKIICLNYCVSFLTVSSLWNINDIDIQLDATITVLFIISISPTCFGQLFAHPQER
jgi:hypothetical protein